MSSTDAAIEYSSATDAADKPPNAREYERAYSAQLSLKAQEDGEEAFGPFVGLVRKKGSRVQFQSLSFVFGFLPFALVGYFLLRKTRFANLFMLAVSLFFYAFGALWYLLPFFFTALLDFYIGQKIEGSESDKYRKRLLVISVVANLAVLSIFKYTGWLSGSAAHLLAGVGIVIPTIALSLPPAISFYTFQSMSYTIDIYRRDFKPYRNVVDYLSFVAFFPHLVAGPIMRARDLLPQLARVRPLPSFEVVGAAMFIILFGLFQKTALADNCGSIVEFIQRSIGKSGNPLPAGVGLLFVYAFAFQIYCDFAAYSTIARGVARLFNVDLMRNFLTPYFAQNPSEFWTRWHISLSTWLRDYLYIPLGGNQHGRLMTARNLLITMFLGGLWHGAGVMFIAWGLYHGLLLIAYRFVPIDAWLKERFGLIGMVVATIVFFHFVCLGWILFRASPHEFLPIWRSLLQTPQVLVDGFGSLVTALHTAGPGGASLLAAVKAALVDTMRSHWIFAVLLWGCLIFILPMALLDYLAYRRNVEFPDLYLRMPLPVKVISIVFLLYGIVFFARREANEFIYFAF